VVGDLRDAFRDRLYAMLTRHRRAQEIPREARLRTRVTAAGIPLVASTEVLYHSRARRPLQDVLTCIRHGVTLVTAGRRIRDNDEHDLRTPHAFMRLYADEPVALARSLELAARCTFSLGEPQNVSIPTRRRRRSASDILSTFGTTELLSWSASTAASPPIFRNSSRMTGWYSIQWPSASMTGWLRRLRTFRASE
jgi:DNA polymerase III alpha subunit